MGRTAGRRQAVAVRRAGREAGGGRLCRVRWQGSALQDSAEKDGRSLLPFGGPGPRGPGVVGGWMVGGQPLREWRQDQGLRGEAGHLAGLRFHGLVWGTRWGE